MKTLKYFLILSLFIGFGSASTQAQDFNFGEEHVQLFTDRTLFICGEEIHFAAFLKNQNDQSKILYLELILPDGTAFVSQKYLIFDKQCQGKMEIPQDLTSGTYYLKVYTKYMRNFGAVSFAYLPLKIVNPYSSEFLSGTDNVVFDSILIENTNIKECNSLDGLNYRIQFASEELQSLKNISISIVPAHSFQKTNYKVKGKSVFTQKFFPETRGLSLSGVLVDSINHLPLASKDVTLSIIDQKNFMPTLSGDDGKFYFSLPNITGNHDVFISTKKEEGVAPLILVDKDFDSEQYTLPSPPFSLSETERLATIELAQSYQIASNYLSKNTEHTLDTFLIPLYGKAINTLYLDKYITMATLEEYFTELPGLVYIKTHKKQKSFAIISPNLDLSIYSPLVLMDWVAVEDFNRILAVSPHGIEKVEVIPYRYVYGNFIYGGIISIRSRKGDFGGISLPKTGLFFNFDFLQPKSSYQKLNDANRKPDTRNTIYWNVFTLQENTPLEIDFVKKSSDQKYWLIVQGINKTGEVKKQVYSVELK